MNDQQIFVLMAKTPNIRAVQIADALDVALCDVSASLRSLVEVGDVLQSKGIAPNQQPTMIYNLSEEFKKSKECRAVMAIIESQKPATAPPAGAPAATPAPISIPVFAPAAKSAASRAEKGIAYLELHGATAQKDLRIAMGLTGKEYPSNFLASAIRNGKVHRDGNAWKPGAAPQPKQLDNVEQVGNIIVATKDASQVPQAVVDAITTAPAPTASSHRCAIWSDGTFELETNGARVAVLSHEQAHALVSFIEKIGAQ